MDNTDDDPRHDHVGSVQSDWLGRSFTAVCGCGWEDDSASTEALACEALSAHYANIPAMHTFVIDGDPATGEHWTVCGCGWRSERHHDTTAAIDAHTSHKTSRG